MTNGRIKIGPGTVYETLMKMQKDNIISGYSDKDKKTVYEITSTGKQLIKKEIKRIESLYNDVKSQEVFFND